MKYIRVVNIRKVIVTLLVDFELKFLIDQTCGSWYDPYFVLYFINVEVSSLLSNFHLQFALFDTISYLKSTLFWGINQCSNSELNVNNGVWFADKSLHSRETKISNYTQLTHPFISINFLIGINYVWCYENH